MLGLSTTGGATLPGGFVRQQQLIQASVAVRCAVPQKRTARSPDAKHSDLAAGLLRQRGAPPAPAHHRKFSPLSWCLVAPPPRPATLRHAGPPPSTLCDPVAGPRAPEGHHRQLCQRRRNSGAHHHSLLPRFLLLLACCYCRRFPLFSPLLSTLRAITVAIAAAAHRPPRLDAHPATAAESGGGGSPKAPLLPARLLLLL